MTVTKISKEEAAQRKLEWRKYWPLVLIGFLGFGFYSLLPNIMGLFIEPLSGEFGWSRTEILSGLTIGSVLAVFLSPVVGAAIDHFGSRRIALPGLVFMALLLVAFSWVDGSKVQWFMLWLFYAFIVLLIKATVWTAAISSSFFAGRSLAIAVVLCGTAFVQTIAPPLAEWLITDFGWRRGYVILGLGWGLAAFVPALLFFYDSKDRRRIARSQVIEPEAGSQTKQEDDFPGLTFGQALRSPPLIRICIATFIVMLTGVGILVNQVPILVEAGLERQQAAYLTSLYGISGIVGKLVTGWLMDRYRASMIGGVTLGTSGLAFLLMLEQIGSTPLLIVGLVVVGYTAGCKLQICAYLTSVYGGLKNYGKIFGVMSSAMAVGGGFGPALAALVYDITGSYELFIYGATAGAILAAYLLFGLESEPQEFSVKVAKG